jgi:hypothetical protein
MPNPDLSQKLETRSEKIEDNDLPVIAQRYREFLEEHG